MTLTTEQQEKLTALKNAMDGYFVNESDIATSFSDNPSDAKVASEKLVKDSLDSHTHTKSQITDFPTIPSKTSDLQNDSGFLTSHQNISGKEDTSNKVTSLSLSSTDTQYPSAKCVYNTVDIVDDKVSVVYNPVSIIDTSDSVYDADRWTEYGTMGIGQQSNKKFIAGGGNGYVIYDGNISNLDNYDITLNLTATKTNTHVYINDNDIGTLPTSQTSILFKKRDGIVKVVYDNNQYDASAVQIIAFNVMSKIRYTIDIVLYQGMIYDVIDSIPSKTSDLTNDSGFLTSHQSLANYVQKSSTTGLLANDGSVNTTLLQSVELLGQTISGLSDVATSGDYDDLINAPTNLSDFNDDVGYASSSHNHNISDLNNTTTVEVVVTYADNTTETLTLLKYTGN